MARSLARPILIATLVAGTLDILAAIGLTLIYGRGPIGDAALRRLRPLPAARRLGRRRRRCSASPSISR